MERIWPVPGSAIGFGTVCTLILLMTALAFVCPASSGSEAASDSGSIGDLTWEYSDGTLTISGEGRMAEPQDAYPWSIYRNSITHVTVAAGVQHVSAEALWGMCNLTRIDFDATACDTDAPMFDTVSEQGCSVVFGDNVRSVPEGMFLGCADLTSVEFGNNTETVGEYAFYGCYKITDLDLPDGLRTIGDFAFANIIRLASVSIPVTVGFMGSHSFGDQRFYSVDGTTRLTVDADSLSGFRFTGKDYDLVKCDTGFSFETNGGNAMEDLIGIEGRTADADAPVKEGYEFRGWYTDEDLNEPYTITVFPDCHLTLYAKWSEQAAPSEDNAFAYHIALVIIIVAAISMLLFVRYRNRWRPPSMTLKQATCGQSPGRRPPMQPWRTVCA